MTGCDSWSDAPKRMNIGPTSFGVRSPRYGGKAPPFREEIIDLPVNRTYPAKAQSIAAGSYAMVPAAKVFDELTSFTVQAYVWPTRLGDGRQALLGTWSADTLTGFGLELDDQGALVLRIGIGTGGTFELCAETPLAERHWYLVAGSFDRETGVARVRQIPYRAHGFSPFTSVHREARTRPHVSNDGPLLIAARRAGETTNGRLVSEAHFDGKIERPRITDRALSEQAVIELASDASLPDFKDCLVAAWDFSRDISGTSITDTGPHALHGECVNLPARAMTGHNWSGRTADWRQAPEEYAAIHFHRDDIYDCAWETDFELTLPPDLASGIYAARLRASELEYHVPFFVRPPRGQATAKIAFLVPTATYMAYANIRLALGDDREEATAGALNVIDRVDLFQWELPEMGLSTYDHHRDRSGVCYTSRLRPTLNIRPTALGWSGTTDYLIVDWLEHTALGFDVITDEDLHREGRALLAPYQVVVTGCHPEYYSLEMLDGLETWLKQGGRLMYMGGNGFYWRISYHESLSGVMEVRRAEGGIRTWAARSGEYHHSFTGELGGLWRRQRRPPNLIAGIGFISQGSDSGSYYRRKISSHHPRAGFVFEGVDDEILGDFGLCLGGAASIELDCVDVLLGTPAHTVVLASSERHSNIYQLVPEELFQNHPMTDATQNRDIRADMVFFETPNGGAVFSTGSIGYAGSLSANGYDNNIERLTTNVLKRFVDGRPFEMPDAEAL